MCVFLADRQITLIFTTRNAPAVGRRLQHRDPQPTGNNACCVEICHFRQGKPSVGRSGWRRSGGRLARSSGKEFRSKSIEVVQHAVRPRSLLRMLRRECRGGSPWASPIPPRLLDTGAGKAVRSMHLLRTTLVFPRICGCMRMCGFAGVRCTCVRLPRQIQQTSR